MTQHCVPVFPAACVSLGHASSSQLELLLTPWHGEPPGLLCTPTSAPRTFHLAREHDPFYWRMVLEALFSLFYGVCFGDACFLELAAVIGSLAGDECLAGGTTVRLQTTALHSLLQNRQILRVRARLRTELSSAAVHAYLLHLLVRLVTPAQAHVAQGPSLGCLPPWPGSHSFPEPRDHPQFCRLVQLLKGFNSWFS